VSDAKNEKAAKELVTKAVTAVVLDDPFFGYMLLRMDILCDSGLNPPTMCTNGKFIKYHPDFVLKHGLAKTKGVLRHEVMHIAMCHHVRRQQRESGKWNMAADYVINAIGKEAGWDLPEDGLFNDKYKDYTTEHVYELLPDGPGGGGGGLFGPVWNHGAVEDHPDSGSDESTQRQLEEDIKIDVLQAANAAKIRGKLPAYLERLANEIRKARLPWKELLARFILQQQRNDYTWMKPNKRFIEDGMYLPTLYSEGVGKLVVAVDTSGSIGQEELNVFLAELNGILEQTRPEEVTLIPCDAEVYPQYVKKYTPQDFPITSPKLGGGGGTDFCPVFAHVEKEGLIPVCLIYLTDMYGPFPDIPPPYPVLWIATSEIEGPFGQTVRLN